MAGLHPMPFYPTPGIAYTLHEYFKAYKLQGE